MCGSTLINGLYKEFESHHQKQSFEEFIFELRKLSSMQTNTFLGILFGLNPSLVNTVNVNVTMANNGIYSDLRAMRAKQTWEIKYQNNLKIILDSLKTQVVLNPAVINQIAKDVYAVRNGMSVIWFFINNTSYCKLDMLLKRDDRYKNLPEEKQKEILNELTNINIYDTVKYDDTMKDSFMEAGSSKYWDICNTIREHYKTKIMDNDVLSQHIDKDALSHFIHSIFDLYYDIIRGHRNYANQAYFINLFVLEYQGHFLPENSRISTERDEIVLGKLLTKSIPWTME